MGRGQRRGSQRLAKRKAKGVNGRLLLTSVGAATLSHEYRNVIPSGGKWGEILVPMPAVFQQPALGMPNQRELADAPRPI